MNDASKMDAKYGPTFYGAPSLVERLTLAMMVNRMLKGDLLATSPEFILNLSLLLAIAALNRMNSDKPDDVMADISDCAVRSYSNMQAWLRDAGGEQ